MNEVHDKIWNALFPRNKAWLLLATGMGLVPVLLGQGLKNTHSGDSAPIYIVLSTGDYSGDLRCERDLLLQCLEVHDYSNRRFDEKNKEVILEEFNITLNIEDAWFNFDSIKIDPRKLFSKHCVSSAALFWGDYDLRTIESDAVVGIGRRATSLESVASKCAIELTHPRMTVIGGERWNQTFVNPSLPLNVRPLGGTDRFVEGWEVIDRP
ncbi:hypothetical protein BDZ45DRAFT_691891 [Acephala macrosclerotiorum]|nr:hypothetical protein BDZ45DRAFT_691891 [Acephala macrosclerotiorum]